MHDDNSLVGACLYNSHIIMIRGVTFKVNAWSLPGIICHTFYEQFKDYMQSLVRIKIVPRLQAKFGKIEDKKRIEKMKSLVRIQIVHCQCLQWLYYHETSSH